MPFFKRRILTNKGQYFHQQKGEILDHFTCIKYPLSLQYPAFYKRPPPVLFAANRYVSSTFFSVRFLRPLSSFPLFLGRGRRFYIYFLLFRYTHFPGVLRKIVMKLFCPYCGVVFIEIQQLMSMLNIE